MTGQVYTFVAGERFADLLAAANTPALLHIFILVPLILTAVMFNNGLINSLSIASIVALLSQGQSYLASLLALLGTVHSFMLDGGLTAMEIIQALQYLDPLIRTLYGILQVMPYFISFLQGVACEAYANEAITLYNNLINAYDNFMEVTRDLGAILHDIQQQAN